MAEKFKSVDDYIQSFPDEVRPVLEEVRQTIRKVLPDSEEVISYNIPTFKVDGRYLVYFAGWQKHVSVYPVPGGDEELEKELGSYRTGPGTLRFPLDKPMPLDLIERVVEHLQKKRSR
jgi:uncharacterized protein YdhG (YjbR/CyaY superfamily)